MLCYHHQGHGEICTNRCEQMSTCSRRNPHSHRKIPHLVETVDVLVDEIMPDVIDGIPVIVFKPYAIAPQATENTLLEKLSPARDPITKVKKETFYTNVGA